jgi:hypothetical protein
MRSGGAYVHIALVRITRFDYVTYLAKCRVLHGTLAGSSGSNKGTTELFNIHHQMVDFLLIESGILRHKFLRNVTPCD